MQKLPTQTATQTLRKEQEEAEGPRHRRSLTSAPIRRTEWPKIGDLDTSFLDSHTVQVVQLPEAEQLFCFLCSPRKTTELCHGQWSGTQGCVEARAISLTRRQHAANGRQSRGDGLMRFTEKIIESNTEPTKCKNCWLFPGLKTNKNSPKTQTKQQKTKQRQNKEPRTLYRLSEAQESTAIWDWPWGG